MKTFLVLTLTMDPYKMPHLGLYCLNYGRLGVSRKQRVKCGSVPFLMISLDQNIELQTFRIQIGLI